MSHPSAIRNVSFVGHPSTGKTTLVDAIAFKMGASARKGSPQDGTSLCDTEPEEQSRHHTLQLSVVSTEHDGKDWTLMDTPGYPEFVAQAQAAIWASDLVVGVVSCASGASFNLRTKMLLAGRMGRGRAIVLTHLDGENADFDSIVHELRERIGEVCVPVLLPNESGPGFSKVERTFLHDDSEWHKRLKDRVMDACTDDDLMMAYLDDDKLTEDQLEKEMPHAIADGTLIPVLVCNPASGEGIDEVYTFLKRFGPSPESGLVKDEEGQAVSLDSSGTLMGTVFATQADPHVGRICLARIHAGTMDHSTHVGLADGEGDEKIGGLFRMLGKKREALEIGTPGEIVAFTKVEKLPTWAHFSQAGAEGAKIEVPTAPNPMVALAVEPRSRADEQKIGEAMHKLVDEDPSLTIEQTKDTHEMVVHGMSDLHLQVLFERLSRRYGVEVDTHLPVVSYRQTISKAVDAHHRHKKQSGGKGQFGECFLRLRPATPNDPVVFLDKVVGGAIPRNLIPAVEKGIREVCAKGILIGGEVMGVEVELYDGKFHAVDSDEASFKSAGSKAFREGFENAKPVLLEPLVRVEIHVPTEDAGAIFSDLTSHRRGHVIDQQTEAGGAITMIVAEAPKALMQTYHRDLNSTTKGEGTWNMSFARFAPVPAAEQKKILAAQAEALIEA
ncbi:MAG TPA: elongation factor G [Planctomycetes bacterium]|nr:elongation factor G [Planctomycetota bacterium]HIL36869.1 elongation factor G [Planctomycetota bacterium]